MAAKQPLPFGTWPSPITPELAAGSSRRFGTVQADGATIYWSESRPSEQGRQAIVRVGEDGQPRDVLPPPFSARSRVHEYGGGEFLVAGGTIYFANDKDQQIYALAPPGAPRRITRAPGMRFADFAHDTRRKRLIAVAEIHELREVATGHALPRNLLVTIALAGKRGMTGLAVGRDFYASPRLSPDGNSLAFLAWDLPNMPWDSAALYLAGVGEDGLLKQPQRIAGGDGSAVFQPEWGPDGYLYFAWDKSGWGGLYRWSGPRIESVHRVRGAELWRAQWVFGMRAFALHPNGRFAASYLARGMPLLHVGTLKDSAAAESRVLQVKAARVDDLAALGDDFATLISSTVAMPAVMRVAAGKLKPIADVPSVPVDPGCISRGDVREFRNSRREVVFGIYYAPASARYRGPSRAAPPALVLAHGGPTSMTDAGLKWRVQYYTSRGFAVFDVNYAGSTGYGRAYRERLDGQWGIADVADCAAAARYLAKAGLADAKKIAISGGSAGGYTTLMALATTTEFAAGSSHYGISDLGLLLQHTHKFESGYLHRLMGTTPAKWKDVFAKRSPINLIDGIAAPAILFQGLEDKVVPPEQSRLIVDKLKQRGIDVAYHEFAGEGHGFRKADTIIKVLQVELAFLRRALAL